VVVGVDELEGVATDQRRRILALREVGARVVRVDDGAVLVVAQHRRRGRVDEFAGVALVAPQGGLGAALGDRLGDPVCEDRVRSVPVSFRR
jgi:hypothetical protein